MAVMFIHNVGKKEKKKTKQSLKTEGVKLA